MFGVNRDIESLRASRETFYQWFSNQRGENEKIHRLLFTKDRFGTERPKMDLLLENFEKNIEKLSLENRKLNERVSVLEKK